MLGIVILNYKNYGDVFPCVESIRKTIGAVEYKIYVVDNNSPNESYVKLLERYHEDEDVEVIQSGVNGGFSAGNNVGFRRAIEEGCDALLCTNSDVEFYENAIKIMLDRLWSEEKLAVVGPKVYNPGDKVQDCNKGLLTPATFVFRRRGLRVFDWFGLEKKYSYKKYDYSKPLYPKGMVSGCCFLVRADVLQEVGYLDENVFLYQEEDILGAKLRKLGYKVILDPKAEIFHYGEKSTGGTSPFTHYHKFFSGLYYLWRYSECSRLGFSIACFFTKSLMWIYAIKHKEYWQYYKRLKSDIRNLKKAERGFNP